MTSTPYQWKCWSVWGHNPNKVPAGQPWHGLYPSHTASRNVHGTASATAPRTSFSHGPQLHAPEVRCFCVDSLFDAEQLVSLHCHLVHLKGAVVFIESKFLLCFDNSVVASPHSLTTFANSHNLGHLPKTLPNHSAKGLHLLVDKHGCCLFSVWTGEAIPICQLLVRVGGVHPWVTTWVGLLNTLVGFTFTDAPGRVSVMVCGAPRGLNSHPIARVSRTLGWTRRKVNELGLRVVPLLVFRTNSKLENWEPNRGASSQGVWDRENWRRWSASLMYCTAHGHWGQRAFESWSGVVCWGICPGLHDSSECFTHRAYGTCARIGSGGKNQGRSLSESAWEKTSLNVVYTCSAILAHWSSWFLTNSHPSWVLAWVTACNCLRTTLKLSASSVCKPTFQWEWKEAVGTDSGIRGDKWWSLPEPSCGAFLRNGMTFSLFPPSLTAGWFEWKSTQITCIGTAE